MDFCLNIYQTFYEIEKLFLVHANFEDFLKIVRFLGGFFFSSNLFRCLSSFNEDSFFPPEMFSLVHTNIQEE